MCPLPPSTRSKRNASRTQSLERMTTVWSRPPRAALIPLAVPTFAPRHSLRVCHSRARAPQPTRSSTVATRSGPPAFVSARPGSSTVSRTTEPNLLPVSRRTAPASTRYCAPASNGCATTLPRTRGTASWPRPTMSNAPLRWTAARGASILLSSTLPETACVQRCCSADGSAEAADLVKSRLVCGFGLTEQLPFCRFSGALPPCFSRALTPGVRPA